MGRRVQVLVVEDHALVADGLQLAADRREDVEVVAVAPTLARGRELAAARRPEVVLLDGQLPDGEGVDAVADLVAAVPGVKILILSGFVSDAGLLRAIEAGVQGVMTKGRSLDEVLDAVVRVADGETVFAPELVSKLVQRMGGTGGTKDRSALSPRELEVLELLASGADTESIAASLYLSQNTVRNHISALLLKLGANSRLEAVVIGIRSRLISPPLT